MVVAAGLEEKVKLKGKPEKEMWRPVAAGRIVLHSYDELAVRDVKIRSITAIPEEFRDPKPGK